MYSMKDDFEKVLPEKLIELGSNLIQMKFDEL